MNFSPFAFLNRQQVTSNLDPDALAYLNAITSEGGTYTTGQADAVNQLFLDLKSYGFYSKIKAMYPFIGGTAASHALNAVNPSGTGQGSGKLIFNGGWTHTDYGITANGTNAYANTQLEVGTDIVFPDGHFSFQQNNPSPQAVGWDGYYRSSEGIAFGCNLNTGGQISLGLWFLGGSLGTLSSYTSLITGGREATSTGKFYEGTTTFYTDSGSRSEFTTKGNYFIGALNENGSPNYYNNNQYSFYTLGTKILATEISDWNLVWNNFLANRTPPLEIEFLVVAGGGGGGRGNEGAGGGGAGGYRTSSASLTGITSYSVTIGAGGAGQTAADTTNGANGSDSVFGSLTSTGGGGGASDSVRNGSNGGSGGGACASGGLTGTGGTGISGQGFDGGDKNNASNACGIGGGGASETGVDGGATLNGTRGGNGLQWLNGTTYAGGGGGGAGVTVATNISGGAGGTGGGGKGSDSINFGGSGLGVVAQPGTANTGGGGGGGGSTTTTAYRNGANGGSGVVIVRYPGSQKASGGTVTSSGGYTYHTFTSSGTFTY